MTRFVAPQKTSSFQIDFMWLTGRSGRMKIIAETSRFTE
jgi:hypothetical protein